MLTLAATLALVLSAAPAPALEAVLARAAKAYNEAEFDAALKELDAAEPLATSRDEQVKVLLYRGVVLANVPDPEKASAAFSRALALDTEAKLPLAVTAKVQADFDKLKVTARSMRAAMAAADAPKQPRLTPDAPADQPPRLDSGATATKVPVVPVVTGSLAVLAVATGAAFGKFSQDSVGQARAAAWAQDKARLRDQAQGQATVANVAFGVAGAAAVTAVVTWLVLD